MIRLKIAKRRSKGELLHRIFVACPDCGHISMFRARPGEKCERCSFQWGNINALATNPENRPYYHTQGDSS